MVDYAATPFETSVKDVDAVLDLVGGEVQQRSYNVIKAGGVLLATTQPPSQEEAAKHQVSASMFITETSAGSLQTVARLVDAGKIKPYVGRVYTLNHVAQAWRESRQNQIEGKIV